MTNEWILAVIEDLRQFADMNDLPRLSEQLGLATATAAQELEGSKPIAPGARSTHAGIGRTVSRRFAAGQDA
jgi:hypothetical protein